MMDQSKSISITPDSVKVSGQSQPYWNDRRKELRNWFQGNAPSLGHLYEGALKILFTDGFPAKERFVGHAVREIGNRLPDFITGLKERKRVEYVNKLDAIAKDWDRSGSSLGISLTNNGDIPSENVELPRKVYRKIESLLQEHKESREKTSDIAIRLFEGIAPENKGYGDTLRPIINHWLEVTKWFMKKTHVPISEKYIVLEEGELEGKFEDFENTMAGLISSFFKTLRGLDEILEDTNN